MSLCFRAFLVLSYTNKGLFKNLFPVVSSSMFLTFIYLYISILDTFETYPDPTSFFPPTSFIE